MRLFLIFLISLKLVHAHAESALCCSGSQCKNVTAAQIGPNLYALLSQITQNEFYLARTDGRPLDARTAEKDLAGYYRFDIKKMKILNKWPEDKLLGIDVGEAALDINEICFESNNVKIINTSGLLDPVGFEFNINLQAPAAVTGAWYFGSQCRGAEQSFVVRTAENRPYVLLQLPLLNCE